MRLPKKASSAFRAYVREYYFLDTKTSIQLKCLSKYIQTAQVPKLSLKSNYESMSDTVRKKKYETYYNTYWKHFDEIKKNMKIDK